jgi:hypothetical protein
MPIHDWTRVSAGTWHDFHLAWIAEIRNRLNGGLLPPDFYAQAEQVIGNMGPDVLTLREPDSDSTDADGNSEHAVAVAMVKPTMRFTAETELLEYTRRRRLIRIRHNSDDHIVAMIELVSPGNKSTRYALNKLIEKSIEAIERGYHVLIVDLFPPSVRDPEGIHGEIWSTINDELFHLPKDEPLTLVAYHAIHPQVAYIEPTAVGKALVDMPLFLTRDLYVSIPLEETYNRAYQGVPRRWRVVLEGEAANNA